ncbi:MAG: HlyD family secretion protein [Leptospirales bacterium]
MTWRVLFPLLGLVVTLAWAFAHWIGDRRYVYSDDAYVQGKITLVSSTRPGRLIGLSVNEGDPVQRGDVIAKIDRTGEFYQRPHDTGKNLEAFKSLKYDMARLEVLIRREKDERDHYDRAQSLLAGNFISRQKLEDIKTEWKKTQIAILETRGVILAEKQALEVSEVHPRNATIFAPISGQVAQRIATLGESLKANQPIVSLINTQDIRSVWLDVFVRETQIWKIKAGQKVRIHIDAWPKDRFYGHVLEFIPAASQAFSLLPAQNAAGTFVKVVQRIPVRVVFDQLSGKQLLPGMSAEVWIDRRSPSKKLPAKAGE